MKLKTLNLNQFGAKLVDFLNSHVFFFAIVEFVTQEILSDFLSQLKIDYIPYRCFLDKFPNNRVGDDDVYFMVNLNELNLGYVMKHIHTNVFAPLSMM